jgi:hypothetical protein
MNTGTRSLSELPIDPDSPFRTTPPDAVFVPAQPSIKPMELWAFLENSDFVRRKRDTFYCQDEVRLIRHDEFSISYYKKERTLQAPQSSLNLRSDGHWNSHVTQECLIGVLLCGLRSFINDGSMDN